MNEIDKKWYKGLRFLSRLSLDEVHKLRGEKSEKFKKNVPDKLWKTFETFKFISYRGDGYGGITRFGLEQLRVLEDIKRKDRTLIASVVAVVFSLVAIAKSMGWI